ncbi:MAG: glutamine-hydrolyzing GMP synthase, partial [Burkholderiales bacterium]
MDKIAVLDFGSQYTQLIARRVREAHVYCELFPHDVAPELVLRPNLAGIVLSGGPASVYDSGSPPLPSWLKERRVPVLAICYGMQLLAHYSGGHVHPADRREYGHAVVRVSERGHPLFVGIQDEISVWMSHGDLVDEVPPGYRTIGTSDNSAIAAMADEAGNIGLQFHPEVAHTP